MKAGWRKRLLCWSLGTLAVLSILLCAGWLWLDSLFEEPEARQVDSLSVHLGDRVILGVLAHPDDELFAAGLLSDAAKQDQGRADLVTLTRGDAGYFEPHICRQEDLGAVRTAELLKYGFVLGINRQEVWDYRDGGVGGEPGIEYEIVRRLVKTIRERRPDLIVTFEPSSGFSLHLDHMATGRLATKASALAGDPNFEPTLGPVHAVRHLAYIEAPRRMLRVLGGDVGRKVAKAQPTPDFSIAVDPSIKCAAWTIHESQREFLRRTFGHGAPPWLLYRLYDKEFYSVRSAHPNETEVVVGP